MEQKVRFMLFIQLSIFCAYPFFGGAEASSLLGKTSLDETILTEKKNLSQDYTDFVKIKSSNAKKVYKNDKGFWEAEFEYGIIMIFIPPGEFQLGSDTGNNNEKPCRSVYLNGYWIGKFEVSFDQYDQFCEDRGISKPEDEGWGRDRYPVINVSWKDAMTYCQWLSEKIGQNFMLPTEAQWEKAARGTDGRKYPWGDSIPSDTLANFSGKNSNSLKRAAPVGSYPNGFSPYGVMDMGGNVYEWCLDWYYPNSTVSADKGPHRQKRGTYRVIRGGSWYGSSQCLKTFFRTSAKPHSQYFHIGFRLCMD